MKKMRPRLEVSEIGQSVYCMHGATLFILTNLHTTTSYPRVVPTATEKSGPTCEQHAHHISDEFISLCAFVYYTVMSGVLSISILFSTYMYSLLEERCQVYLYQNQKRSFAIAVLLPYY